jgi:hypothetical protein
MLSVSMMTACGSKESDNDKKDRNITIVKKRNENRRMM